MTEPSSPKEPPAFEPVPVRPRRDGWNAERQCAFIDALAESGCVEEACKRVGMGVSSAYALRARMDAIAFRAAWDAAIVAAVQRLSDAMFSRAIHGTVTPVFYKGEQVGERRRYDHRLGMFILRYRAQHQYGAWRDSMEQHQIGGYNELALAQAITRMTDEAYGHDLGTRFWTRFRGVRPPHDPDDPNDFERCADPADRADDDDGYDDRPGRDRA